jgi:hypothetical protein
MEAPVRICGANGTIKDCFESFPEALLTLNGHSMILESVVALISHDLILGKTWFYDTNPLNDWKKRILTFERDQRPLAPRLKPLNLPAVNCWRQNSSAEC